MPKGKVLSCDLKEKIVQLYQQKVKQRDISETLSLPRQTVNNVIKKYKGRNCVINLKRGGRKRKTTKREDKLIKRVSEKYPSMSGRQILKELPQVNVSQRTILRRLREEGLPARRPAKKPLLSKKNVKARIQSETHKIEPQICTKDC